MTALKPIENLRVRGAEYVTRTYPTNKTSAKPGSNEPSTDVHHCFPRSQTKSDSYFVEIEQGDGEMSDPIPHAIGLSHEEHMDVEDHRSWIKLEDGVWNWYDKQSEGGLEDDWEDGWELRGPLDPQPGQVVSVEKKKRRVFKGEQKRNRVNWQVKVPKDELEDGAGILDDLIEQLRDDPEILELYPSGDEPPYYILVAALNLAL